MGLQKPPSRMIGVRRIVKDLKSGKIDANHKIQRRQVWKEDQKQGLMASILEGYDIPAIYAIEDENGNLSLLDGKQRISSTAEFVNGIYPLGEEFDDLDEEYFAQYENQFTINDIKGKYFYDLPKDVQNEIETFTFTFKTYKKLTDRQIKNLFYRLNRGTGLNSMELLRVDAEFMLDEIQELENSNFFKNIINMTKTAKNRFTDEEVILQSMALLYYSNTGFSKKEMISFIQEIEDFRIKDMAEFTELINEINYIVLNYFEKAFKEKIKELRKVHIPTLIKVATEAIKNEIEPERFGIWATRFLQNNTGRSSASEYKMYISGATTKEDTITARYDFMLKDFNENIDSIEMPEVNESVNDEESITIKSISQGLDERSTSNNSVTCH